MNRAFVLLLLISSLAFADIGATAIITAGSEVGNSSGIYAETTVDWIPDLFTYISPSGGFNVTCTLLYPPARNYQTLFNPWVYFTINASDDGAGVRKITLNQYYYDNKSLKSSTVLPYTNGTPQNFNITLTAADSGIYYDYNATCTVASSFSNSSTVTQVVVGIGGGAGTGGGTAIIIPQGGNMGSAVPIALFAIGGILIYMAQAYRKNNMITWFELLFSLGNIMMLSGVFVLYSTLNSSNVPFGEVVLPIFQGFLAIYLIIIITMLFKLWKILYAWMVEMARRIK